MKDKFKAMLGTLLPSIVMLVIEIIISNMCVFFAFAVTAHDSSAGTMDEFLDEYVSSLSGSSFYGSYMVCYGFVTLLVFGLWYYRKFYEPAKGKAQLTDNIPMSILGLLLLAVGLQHLSIYLISAIGTLFPSLMMAYEELFEAAGFTSGNYTIPVLLYSIIVAPITEEIIFRGLTLKAAKPVMNFWIANILQASLFAVMHGNVIQGVYAFILALLLGALVHKSGRLIYGIILHITFNLFGTLGSSLILIGNTAITIFLIIFGSMIAIYAGYSVVCQHIPQEE